jgi:hypothetical protein
MAVSKHTLTVSTDATGAGTVTHGVITGEVLEVRQSGTALAGTATYTLTRLEGGGDNGGTILAYTATANPWQVAPRQPTHSVAGGAALYAASGTAVYGTIPVDGEVRLVVAAAGSVVSGSVSLYIKE